MLFRSALAMRYGSISIVKGLKELNDCGVKEVIVLPLYPHYAMSSYETVVEKVKKEVRLNFPDLKLKIISPFYNNKNYIKLLSNKISKTIKNIEYDHKNIFKLGDYFDPIKSKIPQIDLTVVDLPIPFLPNKDTISPFLTCKFTPFKTCTLP